MLFIAIIRNLDIQVNIILLAFGWSKHSNNFMTIRMGGHSFFKLNTLIEQNVRSFGGMNTKS